MTPGLVMDLRVLWQTDAYAPRDLRWRRVPLGVEVVGPGGEFWARVRTLTRWVGGEADVRRKDER